MKRTNILVIEDDHAIRDIVSYVLWSEGYDVLTCDTLEPLEQIAACRPELIVLDEWINAREGTMLCKEIKKIHQLARVPVIILSTASDIEQIALSCKADGFVHKPFDVDVLLAEIKKCLTKNADAISHQ
ncbi:two-component system, OmpR family, phosphate regulon response regulator PhoB [Mucilaginibacter pineti]|uniref:Two-component system, OmpR family, phosphate regulon response regulator PhoB n=1 Tax=Mucilaginibacter pineti TaxID=1391627 RepID=A0A1G7NVF1_9SPHI|nr:response regulator [Mucilaginibacter pineti]SDF77887.1 two-component system, OmpR family, phosphate regulon response regulator PhoB [Mucilaginibacter pineti]